MENVRYEITKLLDSMTDHALEKLYDLLKGKINYPTSQEQLDAPEVINCAKCGTEGIGFGLHGELCKACDHTMRLDAMEHCL